MNRTMRFLGVAAVLLIGTGVLALLLTWRTIEPGHVGVVKTFGRIDEETLQPRLHFIAPWRAVIRVDCRQMIDKGNASIPSAEGLACELGVSCWWRVDPTAAVRLHKEVDHPIQGTSSLT